MQQRPVSALKHPAWHADVKVMEDELKILHEAMVIKERLRVLAELQGAYWDELLERGFESGTAEQLVLEWSRHAYGMTFRSLPEPSLDASLDELLGASGGFAPARGAQPPRPPVASSSGDPSRVPPGESWLQLVQDVEAGSDESDAEDERAA
ncbi:MAG: hypothetical protein JWM90_252 [Thermoleophilia bacterium]|nr:hypothetical protein [Thermoleophilia bacterium]